MFSGALEGDQCYVFSEDMKHFRETSVMCVPSYCVFVDSLCLALFVEDEEALWYRGRIKGENFVLFLLFAHTFCTGKN